MICPAFVKTKKKYICHGIFGSADALLISQYCKEYRSKLDTLVVICAHTVDIKRLFDEIHFFEPTLTIRIFPDWETLPYDKLSPHQNLIADRLSTLYDLEQISVDILLIHATTALYYLPEKKFLAAYTFHFHHNEIINEKKLNAQLTLAGYSPVKQVIQPGEYRVQGNLIDLFPMGSDIPFRIELFDKKIESIWAFNPNTQKNLRTLEYIRLLPCREFPFDEKNRALFQENWKKEFTSNSSQSILYKDVKKGIASSGIEYYLPLFFENKSTIFNYLPHNSQLAFIGPISNTIQTFHQNTKQRYNFLKNDLAHPVLPPDKLFLSEAEFFDNTKQYAQIFFTSDSSQKSLTSSLPMIGIDFKKQDPVLPLRQFLKNTTARILLTAESAGRRATILQILHENNLHPVIFDQYSDFINHSKHEPLSLITSPLTTGFICKDLAIITDNELLHQIKTEPRKRHKKEESFECMIRDLSELQSGDLVVHNQYGIGRYIELTILDFGEGAIEFVLLEYANHTKLYVPITQLHLISQYNGANKESVPLHILGSSQWEKTKQRVTKQIQDTAAELLKIYAQRQLQSGHIFKYDEEEYKTFAQYFRFQETPDQQKAIDAVINDMTSGRLMDRLICGDVGFGKTEVALRAAFIAALDGKQVVMLCPTTLLVEQHFQTFSDRFARWPVKIAEFSRFRTLKELEKTKIDLKNGHVNIVIGTHKLLNKSLEYKNLGLVIVDEEHRFGVQQKEILKNLRAEIAFLTLTATPIPRTLGMALEGFREFSVIATPPKKRLSIKTFVRHEERSVIREAVLRELKRGGQVYFLYNEVNSIQERKKILADIIPEASIGIAHGQMHERELEQVMRNFIEQQFNLLLCTTIIETGIDVPNANTIIIYNADHFGLAQLHQLRGRVGRSYHQAYAYLLINDEKNLTRQARQRLDVVQKMDELGGGFYLAMHDLEIRGAGEILGDKQSGEIKDIGFQLYTEILANAVDNLKSGYEPDSTHTLSLHTEINLHTSAILPKNYCPDPHVRLSFYKKLSSCKSETEINNVIEELINLFGTLPSETMTLIESHRLRLLATKAYISKIDLNLNYALIQFQSTTTSITNNIIKFIQTENKATFSGQDKIKINIDNLPLMDRINILRQYIQYLLS